MIAFDVADKPKDITYPFKMAPELNKRATEAAKRKGITLAGYIRMALLAQLERDEKQ